MILKFAKFWHLKFRNFRAFLNLEFFAAMEKSTIAEMLRIRLENVLLSVKLLRPNEPAIEFLHKAVDPPPIAGIRLALDELFAIGALDFEEILTPLGKNLANLPMDPHCGKMLLYGSLFGCLNEISTIASNLDFKSAFVTPLGREKEIDKVKKIFGAGTKSDHLMWCNAFNEWQKIHQNSQNFENSAQKFAYANFLSHQILQILQKMKKQFENSLKEIGFLGADPGIRNLNDDSRQIVLAIVCAGLYPQVAKIRRTGGK